MLTIAVDTDGCTFPLHAALAEWWTGMGYTPELPVEPDCWHYWRPLGIDDDTFDEALKSFGEANGFRSMPPYPEALVGLNELFDAGHDLIGVTKRFPTRAVEADTFGWIADHLLPLRAMLIGPTAKLEAESDIVVDDNPSDLATIVDLGEAAPVLLDRPWNRECADFVRVSWSGLPLLADRLAEAVAGENAADRPFVIAEVLDGILNGVA